MFMELRLAFKLSYASFSSSKFVKSLCSNQACVTSSNLAAIAPKQGYKFTKGIIMPNLNKGSKIFWSEGSSTLHIWIMSLIANLCSHLNNWNHPKLKPEKDPGSHSCLNWNADWSLFGHKKILKWKQNLKRFWPWWGQKSVPLTKDYPCFWFDVPGFLFFPEFA